MMIAARNAFLMGGGGPTPWTNPYITDGLVAMWDGEWNAGGGVHDPNATTWRDLSGNGLDMAFVMESSSVPTWEAKAYAFGTRSYFASSSLVPAQTVLTGTYTIEIVITAQSTGGGNGGIIGIGDGNTRTFWIWERAPQYNYLIDSIQTAQGNWNRDTAWGFNAPHTFQFSVSPGGAFFNFDGARYQTKTSTSTTQQTAGRSNIGRIGNYGICNSSGNCFRIYSRALTAAEVAANYAVDAARFGL